jgi:hypothetical protein
VGDVSIPNVVVLMDAELPIASVLAARVQEEEEAAEATGPAPEPEVLRAKSGEDEE